MTIVLRLLGEVSYDGRPVAGARSADLLAALAQQPAGVSDARLVEEIWGDRPPAAPAKALQVQVSRVRSQCGAAVIDRYDGGYRLGLADDAVDVWWAGVLAHRARERLAHDVGGALADATAADALLGTVTIPDGDGPLAVLRTRTLALGLGVARTRGLALSRSGRDAEALEPLTEVHRRERDDVEVLVALLRSEAAAIGGPAALDRYDAYRADVADRLGVDPDPDLQRLHRELLAADEPVRSGVRYDADDLLGRSHDLAELRGLVRTGRLVSILGPGGLGKTRIAHVLAREATQPRVHFVELVGVSAGDDVVSEVGSALGVRNSVTGRRTLTPGAARRHPRPHRPGPRRRADAARARQLRARARRGRVAGRLPPGDHPRPPRGHHQPGAAGHRRRAGLPAQPARARATARSCSASGRTPYGPTRSCPTTSSRRSWRGSTGSRWRWSSPRRGYARCRPRRYAGRSTTGSPCSAAATGRPRRGTRP